MLKPDAWVFRMTAHNLLEGLIRINPRSYAFEGELATRWRTSDDGLTYDFDTQSGFISRGMNTQTPLSRGEFGHRVASGRILDTLKERGLPSTWYVPGFTIESHPQAC